MSLISDWGRSVSLSAYGGLGEHLERQKRHQQVHFHLLTQANWLLNRGYKNGPLIFGEPPQVDKRVCPFLIWGFPQLLW